MTVQPTLCPMKPTGGRKQICDSQELGGELPNGYSVSFRSAERASVPDNGDGCTTL